MLSPKEKRQARTRQEILDAAVTLIGEEGPEKFQHILGEGWPVTVFFEKPIEPEKLLATIEEMLAQEKDAYIASI